MSKKQPVTEEKEGGILSSFVEGIKETVGEYIEITDDSAPAEAPHQMRSASPAPAPDTTVVYEPTASSVSVSAVASSDDSKIKVSPKIKATLLQMLRQSQHLSIQAVIKFEDQLRKLSMVSNESERRAAALGICGVTTDVLKEGYQAMLELLTNERNSDRNLIQSKISELLAQNQAAQTKLQGEIDANERQIVSLRAATDSLIAELNNLDSEVSHERRKFEQGGVVFQITADQVEQEIRNSLNGLK